MKIIGLTGGIGAGKSCVLDILTEYGARVIQTDEVAHKLMEPYEPGYQQVVKALGNGFLNPDRSINRVALAELIFQDEAALQTVNSIIHPMTWEYIRQEIKKFDVPLIVVESALFSKECNDIFDEIWYVYTSKANRIRRLGKNRGYSKEKSKRIMEQQPLEAEFRSICDFEIDNNQTLEETRRQVIAKLR